MQLRTVCLHAKSAITKEEEEEEEDSGSCTSSLHGAGSQSGTPRNYLCRMVLQNGTENFSIQGDPPSLAANLHVINTARTNHPPSFAGAFLITSSESLTVMGRNYCLVTHYQINVSGCHLKLLKLLISVPIST